MRLTVGPLPPAVYWRRRAVVLGAALLFMLVLFYSFSGSEGSEASPEKSTSPEAPTTVLTPEIPTSSPSEPPAATPTGAPTTEPAAPPPADGMCTDAEMSVTPVPSQNSARRGQTIQFKLKIKNSSNRTCDRDVGADMQELYLTRGAQKIWSSDTCGTAKGSNVQSFPPGIAHEYQVAWNGQTSTKCANGVADGPDPEPGEYQLYARLGTKFSSPVTITITA